MSYFECFSVTIILRCNLTKSDDSTFFILAASYAKQLSFNHRVLTFNSRDKSAVTMMSIVLGIFVICYGIYLRCGFIYIFSQKSCNDFQYKTLVLVLNSGINPLAYAFFKRDLKKKMKRLLCRREMK